MILGKSLSQIENDSFSEPQKLQFTEFLNDWLNTIIINSVEKTTWENYKLMIEVHINPYFNELAIPLQKLSSLHLQRYYQFEMEHGRKMARAGYPQILFANIILWTRKHRQQIG